MRQDDLLRCAGSGGVSDVLGCAVKLGRLVRTSLNDQHVGALREFDQCVARSDVRLRSTPGRVQSFQAPATT